MDVKRIYLMGMKHTGKSVHGKAIAAALGRKFCDTDALIQELDSTETGMRRTVRDIYIEDGAERFHRLEIAACRLVTERESRLVVATGGGLCDNPEALSTTEGSLRVHLVDSLQSIASRIFRRGIPAFLHTSDEAVARRRFRALYDRRTVAYDETADIRVDLTDLSIQEAQSRIINAIEEYQRAGK